MERIPLRYSDEFSDENDITKEHYPDLKDGKNSRLWEIITRWALIFILTSLIIDTSCFLYLLSHRSLNTQVSALDSLPVRSSYVGLDELYAKQKEMVPIEPIISLPRPIARVDSSRPSESFPRWEGMMSSGRGMVPYNEMQLLLQATVSSVVRFRAIDYGMENCSLTLNIPPLGDSHLLSASYAEDEPILIDVWKLADNSVDMDNLTWESKPRRVSLEGIFVLRTNSTQQLPGFFCPSASFHHFELSCRTPSCDLHVVATAREPFGLYVTQYQTR